MSLSWKILAQVSAGKNRPCCKGLCDPPTHSSGLVSTPYLPAGLKSWELPTFPMFFQIPRTSAGYVLPLAHLRCPLLQGALQTSMRTPGHTFLCHYFACLSFLHLPWLQLDCVAISLHISLLLDCENHKAGIMSSLPSWDPAHQQVLSLPPMYSWSLSVFRVYHLLPLQSQGPAVSPERNSYLSTCFHFYLPMILTSPGRSEAWSDWCF